MVWIRTFVLLFACQTVNAILKGSIPKPRAAICKASPGSDRWPSPESWKALNQSTGGRLLQPTPIGAVCHPEHPSYNAVQCPIIQASWFTEPLHSEDPVSVYWNNWSRDTCLPDPRLPCSSAGYPAYVINATTAEHVKAGVDFARKHNIRLIVKNSGHDYVGRSSAPNALSIWVHHMKSIKEHPQFFRPANCEVVVEGHAITAAAGTQMLEAYRATALLNRTVVGGNGRTVALGGFITGGGHSILAPHHGMAADQVLEMELVTPAGDIVVANECQNTDLFWAMRGGGGSTFGVLTSITLKTIPSPKISTMDFQFSIDAGSAHAFDAITYFVSKFPDLGDAGISGYPIILNSVPSAADGGRTRISGVVGKVIKLNTRNTTEILGHFEPIFAYINSTWPGFVFGTHTTHHSSFGAWYEDNFDPSPVGYGSVMSSRLLDRAALTANFNATKLALKQFSAGGQATVYIVSGKGVHDAQPRGGGTAVHPSWRRTYVHATATLSFVALNGTARDEAIARTLHFGAALSDLAPSMGAYVNEASRYEKEWQHTFWGDNYARLLQIKREVDPDDVFWCVPCVGSERWKEVDDLLCRV